jgi:hypothetical protein
MSVPCPCCGFLTFGDDSSGTFAICPVCYWEDDQVQLQNPELRGGANAVSLLEARENFREFGACERRFLTHVRSPSPDEYADET